MSNDEIQAKRREHRDLDTTIKKMGKHRGSDFGEVQRLKKLKLALKTELHAAGAA